MTAAMLLWGTLSTPMVTGIAAISAVSLLAMPLVYLLSKSTTSEPNINGSDKRVTKMFDQSGELDSISNNGHSLTGVPLTPYAESGQTFLDDNSRRDQQFVSGANLSNPQPK